MSQKNALTYAAVGAILAMGLGAAGTAGAAEEKACASLKNLTLENVRIDLAEQIVPNPVWPFPPSLFNQYDPPGTGAKKPFCRVTGVIEAEIGFEVWLPQTWNGKLQGVGNGEFVGAFTYSAVNEAVEAGYAAATTDVGHKSDDFSDVKWAKGRMDRVENFGHRAHHLLAVTAKEIVTARYGRPAKRSYYTGCSSGGWQGLTEAQKYPDDYDGITIGAPAQNLVRLQTTGLWLAQQVAPGAEIGKELAASISGAARAYCDVKDGLKDGIVSMPLQCDFDPASLACGKGKETASCLKPAQIATARLMFGPRATKSGLALYPGPAFGAETYGMAGGGQRGTGSLLSLVKSDYKWSPETFNADRDIPQLEARFGDMLGALNPDLNAFAARGGKLILWHGWIDPVLSPYNTLGYVDSVQQKMGAKAVENFMRVYMLPGVEHCFGGVGPDEFDSLAALDRWVEEGIAPTSLVATQRGDDGKPVMTRPLCPHPQVVKYKASGDTNVAASFTCATP